MSKRATLVLAVTVLALVAYILKFERTSLTSKELDQRSGKVLTSFVREKLSRLEIQRKGKRVVLERKPGAEGGFGAWHMVEPWRGEADESEVDQVLGELEWLDARRTLSDLSAQDRAQFGFDKPRYRVTFTAGDVSQRLLLGASDVHGQGVYASVDDGKVAYVVGKTLLEALDHEPGHYRNKELMGSLVTAWGRKLSIDGPEGRTELEKRDGRWWATGEGETFADKKGVESVLRALDEIRATRFLEGAEADRARQELSKPARAVQLRIVPDEGREDKTPEFVELRLGAACPGHADETIASAGASGTAACVSNEDTKVFAPSKDSLRQAAAISAGPSEIERFELSAGKTKLSFKRDGEKWLDDAGKAVDREAVEQWLEDLSTERALTFLKLGPLDERGRLTVYLADDTSQTAVVGGLAPDGSALVRRDQEPVLVRYRAALSDLLTLSPRRFQALQLWAHQPSQVQAIEAQSGPLQRKLQLQDGEWRAATAEIEESERVRVRDLLRDLTRMRALGFITDRARREHGFDTPSARLTLSLIPKDGVPRVLKLDVGAATLRGAYARVADGAVYDVPREVVSLIDELAGGKPAPAVQEEPAEDEPSDGHEAEGHDHEH